MNDNYNFFCDRVCSYIDHATDKEKRAIHKELSDHMEDHAQALIDLGRSEEEAQAAAIVAMGDPEEIGRELNKEYPFIWLLVSRIALTLSIILAILLIDPIATHLGNAKSNLQARYAPMSFYEDEFLNEVNYRMEIPNNGDIAYVYALDIGSEKDGRYYANIGLCVYDENIFGKVSNSSFYFNFYPEKDGDPAHGSGGGFLSDSVITIRRKVYVEPGQESIYIKYEGHGELVTMEIPLNWEGIE